MTFRISTNSNYLLFQNLLSLQNQKLNSLSEQISSGKRINRPSDDPINLGVLNNYKNQQDSISQYLKNLDTADRNWQQIENSVSSINDILTRAKELSIQGNNGTLDDTQRSAIAEEVNQLSQQLVSIRNTQIDGQYIFAGFRTNTKPFALDPSFPDANPAAIYSGDSNVKSLPIDQSTSMPIQLRLDDLYVGTGAAGEAPILQSMANLEQALRTNNTDDSDPASVGQAIEDLGTDLKNIQSQLANVGAKTNEIDATRSRLQDQQYINNKAISGLQDVDMANATFEFQKAKTALQATIMSANVVLNKKSLMDFIQ